MTMIPYRQRPGANVLVLILVWLGLLAGIVGMPYLIGSPTLGDDLVRNTVRLSLVFYAAAATLMLLLRREEWAATVGRGRLARWCWTLAWMAFLVHLVMAFQHYHHWSHADAVEHTRAVSGVGEGIYVSHLFALLWSADVVSWWLWPGWYAGRPGWVDRWLHGFMAFVIFNAMIVYEEGLIRWAGIVLFAELIALYLYRWVNKRGTSGKDRRSLFILPRPGSG